MIYITFNNNGKEIGGALLATYYKQANTNIEPDKYYLVRLHDGQDIAEVHQNNVILTTLNLVPEWIRVSRFISNDSTDRSIYTDYEGYEEVFGMRFKRV